jgi:hypothetical protein
MRTRPPGPAAHGEVLDGRHDERINPAESGEIVGQRDEGRRAPPGHIKVIDSLKDAVAELKGCQPRAVLEYPGLVRRGAACPDRSPRMSQEGQLAAGRSAPQAGQLARTEDALFVRAYVPLTPGIGGRSRPDGHEPCVITGREHPPGRFKVVGEEDFPIGRIDAGAEPESFEPQALDRGSLADQPIDLGPIRAVDWQMKMGDALL